MGTSCIDHGIHSSNRLVKSRTFDNMNNARYFDNKVFEVYLKVPYLTSSWKSLGSFSLIRAPKIP